MEKITDIVEGVKKLLTVEGYAIPDFSFRRKKDGEYIDRLINDGSELPLFDDTYDQRIFYIAKYGAQKEKNSALNVYSFVGSDISLEELMFREMYIAEYCLHDEIETVMAFMKPNAANMILSMKNGTAANIELGNTLAPGSMNQCQHRLITSHGMACDRSVAVYTAQSEINLFTTDKTEPTGFDDDQVCFYGLSDSDVKRAVTIHAILTGKLDASSWCSRESRYLAAIKAARISSTEGRVVALSETGI